MLSGVKLKCFELIAFLLRVEKAPIQAKNILTCISRAGKINLIDAYAVRVDADENKSREKLFTLLVNDCTQTKF